MESSLGFKGEVGPIIEFSFSSWVTSGMCGDQGAVTRVPGADQSESWTAPSVQSEVREQ